MRRSEQVPDSAWHRRRWIVRCQFHERDDDEVALVHARMRNFEPGFADPFVPVYQNIQIQRARSVPNARRPIPAKFLLNLQQTFEQLSRLQIRLQCDHRIEKPWLVGESYRLGGIERGAPHQGSQRLEPIGGGGQRGLGIPGRAGQVRPHADEDHLHTFSVPGFTLESGDAVRF